MAGLTIPHLSLKGVLRVTDPVAYLAAASILVYFAAKYRAARKARLPLPPCPPKQGALGHVAIMPKTFEYLAYGGWAEELNTDIFHLQLGKKTLIVLNSWEAITDLLETNSAIYSDRRQDVMKSKVVGWDWLLSSLPYGERWRKGRLLFHQHLHPTNLRLIQPRQLAFVRGLFLPQLLDGPSDVIPMVKHFSGGLSISVAYGIEVQAKNDPYVEIAENSIVGLVQASIPGRWLVDTFPVLRFVPSWFPGAGWKRQGLLWRQAQIDVRLKPYQAGMRAIDNGTAKDSFLVECIQALGDKERSAEEMELIQDVSSIIFSGGAETVASVVSSFLLAMLCHPHVQAKAREELDRVVGVNRLPTFDDRPNLPYITAIMKECLRWQSPNPVGVAHMASEEGVYRGYRIPKGASLIGNVWLLMHDERDYPHPMEFKPERFLNADGTLDENVRDPSNAIFGFGRRLCPGRHIGLSVMWLTIASTLAAFTIEKGLDDDGVPIEPEPQYNSGFIRSPLPFRATFRVRSQEMEDLIRSGEESHL